MNINNIKKPLESIIQRVEKLEEEKRGISSDISDIFKEAKGNGLDVKTIKTMIKIRKLDAAKRSEEEFLRDTYLRALGLIAELDE